MTKHWKKTREAQVQIAAAFPELFSLDNPVPFKIGFHADVHTMFPAFGNKQARRLLAWLTQRRAYLIACQEGAPRYGFTGPCGVVTAAEAEHAKARFAERMARSKDDGWSERIAAQ